MPNESNSPLRKIAVATMKNQQRPIDKTTAAAQRPRQPRRNDTVPKLKPMKEEEEEEKLLGDDDGFSTIMLISPSSFIFIYLKNDSVKVDNIFASALLCNIDHLSLFYLHQ
jgi:hypothetical protein